MLRFVKEIKGTRSSDHYATPKAFYRQLDDEFGFDFDPCPLNSRFDGLCLPWNGRIYANPPYSNIEPFISKGIEELDKQRAQLIVFLLPVRTDTRYWHELILQRANEIRFVKGRLNFNESSTPAPFPCAIIIFRRERTPLTISTFLQITKIMDHHYENQF